MRRRTLIVPPLTLVALLAAVEISARVMDLDQLQHESIAVAAGKSLGETWHQGGAEGWLEAVEALNVDYLPDDFRLESGGFHSRWGFCDFDFEGPSILAMGDSSTRQTMTTGDGPRAGDLSEHTWPRLLSKRLGPAVQVCVAAENGYHPRDLSKLLDALQPRLEPAMVVALLCENDLSELSPRVRVDRGDAYVFYRAVPHRMVLPSLYWYPLYASSEAYRFTLWRLALAMPDRAGEIEVRLRDAFGVDEALRRMDDQPGALSVFYLPPLDDSRLDLDSRVGELAQRSGVDIRAVELSPPRAEFRRTDEDPVHINVLGHLRVVDAMLPVVRAALGPPEAEPGSQP